MKYCKSCNVSVNSPSLRCPLCYAGLESLDNHPEPHSYPDLSGKAAKYNLVFRLLLFFSLTICIVCVTINLASAGRISWSLLVLVNIAYIWVSIGTAIKPHSRLGFNILVQVVSLSVLMVIFDFFAGHTNWALNYVVPFLFISATLSITVIIIVKRIAMGEFILYFVLTALLGFIPLIMLAAGQVTVRWPAVSSAVYSGLSLVSIFIFADHATKNELKKRFHI